ncbi:FAD-binding oxidoreductase [Echinicola marina]|uniref:NAD(P)/FAD-dependent oxidoreductase n=1 Tax=Echinicola marina TaxID=2859768 RepID=UPI001CF66D97|nr:FAD-dependent oxidoreductase [Echinicola marina]UCS91887.1 FAD-binding oxidoreductase [Echinicola marina]
MLSYWEKKNLLNYDLVVIGAGFVGLSTAIHYKENFPGRSVLVLERGVFPSGASTRNAGFACFGSLTEILDDLEKTSEETVFDLLVKRRLGLKNIRSVFGDEALDYAPSGGFDLIRPQDEACLGKLGYVNGMLRTVFGGEVFEMAKPKSFGFGKEISHLVKNRYEGQLDPAKYLKCLWQKCQDLQINILTGAEVTSLEEESCKVHVHSFYDEDIIFQGRLLAVCTNAFVNQLIGGLDIKPGRGMIMVSEFIPDFPWQGTFHMDKGYVYFRNVDNRLLIGGGRNLDESTEMTTDRGINSVIKNYLVEQAKNIVFPGKNLLWENEWSGSMAFGEMKRPIIQQVNARVAVGVRLGGMGVAIGWEAGKELAHLLGS